MHHEFMIRVFLADAEPDERKALRMLLQDLKMEVVGEAGDWPATLERSPTTGLDMLLVDWAMLPAGSGEKALAQLRLACSSAIVVVLISHLEPRQQAALSAGADMFISKSEPPERLARRLQAAAERLRT